MSEELDTLRTAVLEDGVIDADEITQIRTALYDDGVIDRDEADFLFALNDTVASGDATVADDADWTGLFVEALSDHVLKDETSPGAIDDDEATYLMDKIGADGQVDGNELALLVNIAATATEECPTSFCQYTLDAVQAAVIADGIVDADEVEMMSKVIYGTGGGAGAGVDRAEADMLFAINDATTDNEGHDAGWQALFVKAIASHVLDDDVSPGAIDADEGAWLKEKIEGDGKQDANEVALMTHIKANATSMEGPFAFYCEMWTP
jgi:uncharacterized membrane protein YebE (DUF533 family)